MEKQQTHKNKLKKPSNKSVISENDLTNTVPSAPTLEDFITDDTGCVQEVRDEDVCCNQVTIQELSDTKIVPKENVQIDNKSNTDVTSVNTKTNHSVKKNNVESKKQKPQILEPSLLYPDLTHLKDNVPLEEVKHIKERVEEMSIHEFHENSLKNPVSKHVYEYVHAFLNNENNLLEDDWFHCLIQEYLKSRSELMLIKERIIEINKHCVKLRSLVWTIENCTATQTKLCKDNMNVTAKHDYRSATLNQSVLDDLERNSKDLRENCHKSFVTQAHISTVLKIKIEHFVNKLCSKSQKTEEEKIRIQTCISILFKFIRKEQTEKQFIEDIKIWLDTLIREFLNCDICDKEMFLLNQILRCPPGISWAIKYFQLSEPSHYNAFLLNSNIELCLIFLYTILSPIEKRDHFLKSADISLGAVSQSVATWILVDSDGEDDSVTVVRPLKESDIISLINQIPFELFFSSILISNEHRQQNQKSGAAHNEFINFINFCTKFVYILSKGLRTYSSNRYSNLTMLLGRLIKHTLDYVTEEFKIYLTQRNSKSVSVEYDAFCVRVVHSIIWSNNTCKWQLLTTVTWQHISAQALWCIFEHIYHNIEDRDWALHKKQIHEYETQYQHDDEQLFLDKVMKLPENELYFLMHTLSNMTMNRKSEELKFIIKITDIILKIGFCEANSSNSKWARIYISSICEKYPQIISYIISTVKNKITPSMALYLFKEIKLCTWIPQQYDMNIINSWLIDFNDLSSENELARSILSNLNYGMDNTNGQLFLQASLHYEIGLTVTKSCLIHDKESTLKNKSYVTEGIKHVTNLVWSSTSNSYHKWCLEMLRKLRIHCLSQTDEVSKSSCVGSKEPLKNVFDIERMPEIYEGVNNSHPVACYLSLLATTSGHSVPVIYNRGLSCLRTLDQFKEHESVIHVMHLIVPLFLECQDELVESTLFTDLLNSLVKVPISKQIFGGDSDIAGIAVSLNNMIVHQIMSYQRYALSNPSSLIIFWLKCLFKLDWGNNSVIYILNNLSQMVYIFPNSWNSANDILKSVLINTSAETKSLFSWIYPANNLMTYSNSKAPWLEKLILQMKHHLLECSTGLWQEIIEQINMYEGKLNVEKAIQKAAVVVNTAVNPKQLSVYRWAELGLEVPVEHPIAPLIWHQFFCMLLERVTMSNGRSCCFGLNFLQEGHINVRRLMEHFEKAEKIFSSSVCNMQAECSNEQYDQTTRNKMEFHHNLSRLYGLFKTWLNDSRVFDANFELRNLAQHYEPAMLHAFMTNNYEVMIQFLDTYSMHKNIMDMVKNFEDMFLKSSCDKMTLSQSRTFSELSPQEKIKAKLSSYETPVKLEPCEKSDREVFHVEERVVNDLSATKRYLQRYIQILTQFARGHGKKLLEHTTLDYILLDLYPSLYQNVPFKKSVMASCSSFALYDRLMLREPKPCTGPVEIILEYTDLQINESIDRKILRNVNDTDNLISNAIMDLPIDLCLATATIQEIVRLICIKKSKIGKDMFYFILDLSYKEKNDFPPLDKLYNTCLNDLAKAFYYNDEKSISELLKKIECNINFLPLLSNFLPMEYLTASGFVIIYSYISSSNLAFEDTIMLLEKFDVAKWLSTSSNNHVYILELLYIIEGSILSPNILDFDEKLFEIHKIHVQHLMNIYNYNFPNYYWYVLELTLKGLNNLNITPYCLECFINAYLEGQKLEFSKNNAFDRQYWENLKSNNNPASYRILQETSLYLQKHFLSERLQNGVHGLYSRYRKYLTAIRVLLGTITACSAHNMKQMLAESFKIDEKQFICAILSAWKPWLLPLWPSKLEEKPPDWVLQLTLDGPLLPWSSNDLVDVNKMITTYIDCALTLDKCLPEGRVLCYLLDVYITDFCNSKIPSHVIKQINAGLLQVPWKKYKINTNDIVNMHRIIVQFLPDCHYLIAYIFVQMKWKEFLEPFWNVHDISESLPILSCYMELLVHVAYEPSLRNKESMLNLIENLLHFNWHLIECSSVNTLLNWFVMSANPVGLLSDKPEYNTDRAVLKIIESTCGIKNNYLEFGKIFSFVRANIRLLEIIAKRNLATSSADKIGYQKVIEKLLNLTQCVTNNNSNREMAVLEGSELYKEIFLLLNLHDMRYNYVELAQQALFDWINNGVTKYTVISMLRILFTVTNETNNAILMECLIENYFKTTEVDSSVTHWHFITQELGPVFIPTVKILSAGSFLMSLHIKFMRLMTENNSKDTILKNTLCMQENIYLITPGLNNEHLLPLLWFDILHIIIELMKQYKEDILPYLNSFSSYLEKMADTSAGILGMIKLKRETVTEKFRILCRIIQTFILSQIYICNSETVVNNKNVGGLCLEQNVPEYDIAKQKLTSRKVNNIEKLLIERGLQFINDKDMDISSTPIVLKSLLSLAYGEYSFYESL